MLRSFHIPGKLSIHEQEETDKVAIELAQPPQTFAILTRREAEQLASLMTYSAYRDSIRWTGKEEEET